MSKFKSNTDMFGMYVKIPTGYTREMHVYKVVSRFNSNSYCDVPLVANSKPTLHNDEKTHPSGYLEDVLNVVHCGIDETNVVRVALKDCEIVPPKTDVIEIEKVKQMLDQIVCKLSYHLDEPIPSTLIDNIFKEYCEKD